MKKFISFIVLFVWAVSLFAVPANRKPIVIEQSDGTTLKVVIKGDEAMHFYATLDGKCVVKGENGDYFYATFSDEEGFVSTGVLAHDKGERSDAENELLEALDYEAINSSISKAHKARSAKYRRTSALKASSNRLTKGEVLVPVLLVQYQDVKFNFTKDDFNKLLNEENYKYNFKAGNVSLDTYGSARDYFIAQSGGQFTPKFIVSDIVTLPQKMAYYGGNDNDGDDKNPQQMIKDALDLTDSTMDFSQFDNDKNGEVEFVYCIYAGYSESNAESDDIESTNTIWPHQWELADGGSKKKVDGVYCNVYACSSELNLSKEYENYGKWIAGIGTLCHEFSHCLGLHDVYDVYYESTNWCMDEWDIMDQGSYAAYGYIPVGYNSFEKDACGWKDLVVLDEKGTYSMEAQTRGGVGYKIVNDANSNEYFVLENRKREGWDQALAADGMMIIHVEYNKSKWNENEVNTQSGRPGFQIVPADNELLFYSHEDSDAFYKSLAGDLWPGKNNNTEFTDKSFPAAKVFTGGYLGKPVTGIKYENEIVSFDFMRGVVGTPANLQAVDVTNNSFVANWNEVDDATGYVVELYKVEEAVAGDGEVETLVNEDFLKCSKPNTTIAESEIDNYMTVSGWTGDNIYSESGMLRIGSSKNTGTLSTPMLNAVGDIEFSAKVNKYNSKDGNFKLVVEVKDASGNVIATKNVTSAGTFSLNATVNGDFYISFNTVKVDDGKPRVLIDDVNVSATLSYKKSLVETVNTSVATYKFNGLLLGTYLYRVKAVEGDAESEFSDFLEVVLGTTSVVELQGYDSYVEVYAITGVRIYAGDVNGLQNLSSGIYVVKSNTGAKKIKIE